MTLERRIEEQEKDLTQEEVRVLASILGGPKMTRAIIEGKARVEVTELNPLPQEAPGSQEHAQQEWIPHGNRYLVSKVPDGWEIKPVMTGIPTGWMRDRFDFEGGPNVQIDDLSDWEVVKPAVVTKEHLPERLTDIYRLDMYNGQIRKKR